MDRKQWLTLIFREANLFLETHAPGGVRMSAVEVDELEPELHGQLKEVFHRIEHLEDIIKHSMLKNPAPDLWYGENEWPHVLAAVASACLVHDVKGVICKIAEGDLPRVPSHTLLEPVEEVSAEARVVKHAPLKKSKGKAKGKTKKK